VDKLDTADNDLTIQVEVSPPSTMNWALAATTALIAAVIILAAFLRVRSSARGGAREEWASSVF
jgi:hypothetical protein